MFHVKHTPASPQRHSLRSSMLLVVMVCALVTTLLCSCQSSPSFSRDVSGASALEALTGYLSELADSSTVPDSVFDPDELLAMESSEDYEEATELDNASAQVEAKALPKPKVTLPSDNPDAEYDKQTVLVSPVEGVGMAEVADAMGVDVSAMTDAGMGYYSVALPDETSAQEALEALQETTGVAAAQPDFVYHLLGDEDGSEPSSGENADTSIE